MADKEMFSYWVTQPELLEGADAAKLEQMTRDFPYFQLAHMLLAKTVSMHHPELMGRYLPKAAVHSLNRKALQMLLENEVEWSVTLLDRLTRTQKEGRESIADLPKTEPDQAEAVAVSHNELPAVPFDPTVLTEFALSQQLVQKDEQPSRAGRTPIQELIDKFIKAEPIIGSLSPEKDQPQEVEDLSLRNQMALEDFATESFAEILARQGKPERAIAIYEKLILKIPEKKDYFAKKIEKLK
ncbi:tetratricopeptide repeat protein [Ravibacter arvi]|uniref:Tetratricopeptide repeat protein n=1 Tax=Ravibacter arvi TaxID=2051041 RepID=A0ABP8M056_9BACT